MHRSQFSVWSLILEQPDLPIQIFVNTNFFYSWKQTPSMLQSYFTGKYWAITVKQYLVEWWFLKQGMRFVVLNVLFAALPWFFSVLHKLPIVNLSFLSLFHCSILPDMLGLTMIWVIVVYLCSCVCVYTWPCGRGCQSGRAKTATMADFQTSPKLRKSRLIDWCRFI